jgi:hypothetical protein
MDRAPQSTKASVGYVWRRSTHWRTMTECVT